MAEYSTYSLKTESSPEAVHAVKQEIEVEIYLPLPTGPQHVKMEPKHELVKEEPHWMEEEPTCSYDTESSIDAARAVKQEIDVGATVLQPTDLPYMTMEPKLETNNEVTSQCGREDSGENRFMDSETLLANKKISADKSGIKCTIKGDHRCEICEKLFTRKNGLKTHMALHTTDHKCEICQKCFAEDRTLKNHMVRHTGRLLPHYQCEICKKCFADNKTKKMHKITHTSQRDYICKICKKVFAEDRSLKMHMVTHTRQSDHRCEMCNKCFARKGDLNRHIKTHNRQRRYQCDICQKIFSHKGALTMHITTHTEQRNYRCDICERYFKRNYQFKSHMHTHRSETLQETV